MIDLTALLEKRRSLAAFPKALHSAEDFLKDIFDPMLDAFLHTGPWMSLNEAMQRSGRSASYFRARLDSLGGRCRLEDWEDKGLAKQAGRQWMISPSVLPERKRRVHSGSREEMTAEEILQQIEEAEE